MDPIVGWTEQVRSSAPIRLDLAAMWLSACFLPDIDPTTEITRIDELAAAVPAATTRSLVHHLFVTEHFRGDSEHYDSPLNSFLPTVLDRRLGMPIALAVLAIEVGRRIDVPLVGIGLPGHFLLRERDADSYIDAFAGGVRLDHQACIDLFGRFDPTSTFHDRYLDDVSAGEILGRMVANLLGSFARRHRRADFALGLRLRAVLSGVPVADRLESARRLVETGHVDWAADVLDSVAADRPSDAHDLAVRSIELRARLN